MGYQIKGFFEVKIYDINPFSLVRVIGHLVVEGNEIGQANPTRNKPMLASPQDVGVSQSIKDGLFNKLF